MRSRCESHNNTFKRALEMEGIVANADEDLCSGCMICESLCPYSVVEMKNQAEEKRVAHVIEALCKGCGVCGTACPTKAMTFGHFTTDEMMAEVKSTLVEEVKA